MSPQALLLLVCILVLRTEEAILKTFDLSQQVTYPCPREAELSCAIVWKMNPGFGLLGQSENLFRLQCQETPPIDSNCNLPPMFSFNETKLIVPRNTQIKVRNIGEHLERGDFVSIDCKPTQSAICVALHGEGMLLQDTVYMLNLRCKDVHEKACHNRQLGMGDKLTVIMPFEAVAIGDWVTV